MSFEPGAMAAPTKDITEVPTNKAFLAWKVSDADAISGQMTACTSDSEFGTHVSACELLRLVPIYESCESQWSPIVERK
jgi:hypothetical protein